MTSTLMTMQPVRIGPRAHMGEWVPPPLARGLVLFVEGRAQRGVDVRQRYVADVLHQHGMATLQSDPLGDDEMGDDGLADHRALARRVTQALTRLADAPAWADRPVGLLAAGIGAPAALRAAAEQPSRVAAVVSQGGRCDLAADVLSRVQAPTLLIVGALDSDVLDANRDALRLLRGPKRLEVVPGAAHGFEEPGALDGMAHLAGDWFARHFADTASPMA